jgi:M6 family metalloprotease-like protein
VESRQLYIITVFTILIPLIILITSIEASANEARVIVIPVDFPDQAGEGLPEGYVGKLNVSMNDYWREVSYGKLVVKLYTISKWLRLDKPYSFYGEDEGIDEPNSCRLLVDAVKAADPFVDFRKYDYIIIMHSGRDQAYTHDKRDIHSKSAFCGRIPTDEKTIIEYISVVSYADPLGIWAHEFGHLLGLPDLYDTSSREERDSFVGPWDLMAEGSWNGPLGSPGSVPAGLTSWSRIKLGWIEEESIFVVEKGSRKQVLLKPLHESGGIRVINIVLDKPREYYLVEAREKIGYDRYLPSRGVLILYVDENKGSGEGIVKVTSPPGRSLYQATYTAGGKFQDKSLQLTITVDEEKAGGYTITIVYGLPRHVLTITTIPSGRVWINGTEYVGDRDGFIKVELDEGVYVVNAQEELAQDDVRYAFEGWSDGLNKSTRLIILDRDQDYILNYSKFYRVEVSTDYGEVVGGGWYKSGEKASIELLTDRIIEFKNNTRLVFSGWGGDIESNQSKIFLTVDSPKTIKATWIKQYKVIVSTIFNEFEEKWVNEGDSITVEALREIDLGNNTKLVFYGWSGVNSSNEKITLRVDRPLSIKALWKKNYLAEIIYLRGIDEKSYWVREGEELHLGSEYYKYVSEKLRLRFNGWMGDIKSEKQNVTVVVSSPIRASINWVREYRIQPYFTTIDKKPLAAQPSRLTLYRSGEYIEWIGEPVWVGEGLWSIREITWSGLDISAEKSIIIDSDIIVIPTTLKEIKIRGFDLLGKPIQNLDVSVIVDGIEVFRANGGEPRVYIPLNAKAILTVSYESTSVRITAPSNDLKVTIPVISLTATTYIALGQIILTITIIIILVSTLFYMKKPIKTKTRIIIVSTVIKRISLIEL